MPRPPRHGRPRRHGKQGWGGGRRAAGSDGQRDEAVVALDVPLEDLGDGAQHALEAGPVQLDALEGPPGHHGGRPGPVQQQRDLPWGRGCGSGPRLHKATRPTAGLVRGGRSPRAGARLSPSPECRGAGGTCSLGLELLGRSVPSGPRVRRPALWEPARSQDRRSVDAPPSGPFPGPPGHSPPPAGGDPTHRSSRRARGGPPPRTPRSGTGAAGRTPSPVDAGRTREGAPARGPARTPSCGPLKRSPRLPARGRRPWGVGARRRPARSGARGGSWGHAGGGGQ